MAGEEPAAALQGVAQGAGPGAAGQFVEGRGRGDGPGVHGGHLVVVLLADRSVAGAVAVEGIGIGQGPLTQDRFEVG
jgi:hypothetical protein